MIFTILIVILSLIFLMALHEFGHFLIAKKLGIVVEEFGIGYPPRLLGKKWRGTLYSINLLPLGAFVKILGADDISEQKEGNFAYRPIWQRAAVLLGGVISFWIMAFLIFTFLAVFSGLPNVVEDSFVPSGSQKLFVQIVLVNNNSPAQNAGLKPNDILLKINAPQSGDILQSNKVKEIQNFIYHHKGENLIFDIQRGEKILQISVVPRYNYPLGEGPLGVALARVTLIKSSWYQAPLIGLKITAIQTKNIPFQWYEIISRKIRGEKVADVRLIGPVGLGEIMHDTLKQGIPYYLMLIGIITIYLAFFNVLPIPALDGGRIFFLILEALRKKSFSPSLEQKINSIFFILLVILAIFATFQDIRHLF